MNQSSSDTADVHATQVITTPPCQTSYCSQKYTAAEKENEHLLANSCSLLYVNHHVLLPSTQECVIL